MDSKFVIISQENGKRQDGHAFKYLFPVAYYSKIFKDKMMVCEYVIRSKKHNMLFIGE